MYDGFIIIVIFMIFHMYIFSPTIDVASLLFEGTQNIVEGSSADILVSLLIEGGAMLGEEVRVTLSTNLDTSGSYPGMYVLAIFAVKACTYI